MIRSFFLRSLFVLRSHRESPWCFHKQTSDSKATHLICFNSLTNTQNLSHGCDEEKERKHLGNLFQHLANKCVLLDIPDIQQYAPANFLMHLLPLLHQGLTLTGQWCNEHQELLAEPVL
ncbi:hypothetical protein ILYODFUR_011222 [Ilyodon furcidens]|uniref:Uncharacterized protein n=1 Tax=Ilyodon furcidens TaxID=33524 RepID=A0ABV0TVI0_9TELE